MSLSSAANIARSGLNAVATEASVLSRNISGVSDTLLYSRKIVNVSTGAQGAEVVSVTRAANQAVFENVLSSTASAAAQDALSAGLDALHRTVGDVASDDATTAAGASSPAARLSAFADALQSYAAAPSDVNFAANAVTTAKGLAVGLNEAAAIIHQTRSQADAHIADSVKSVNLLLSQVQRVNSEIVAGTAMGVSVADAEDARDNILATLAKEIGITTNIAQNNDMSIYTDGGVTLFQGGSPRLVAFSSTETFTAATTGGAVYIDGAPVTGALAAMPLGSGAIAGYAALRDGASVAYEAQLDSIAGSLIATFAEADPLGVGSAFAGLFMTAGSSSLPAGDVGLASAITVNPSFDAADGGNPLLLRDGVSYDYNTDHYASFAGRLSGLLANLSASQSFSPAGGIATSGTLAEFASASIGWLEGERSAASSASTRQNTLLSTAKTALSNGTGVNLDDEMAKMLDLEQSYAASAKLITTIESMFRTLLSDIGNV